MAIIIVKRQHANNHLIDELPTHFKNEESIVCLLLLKTNIPTHISIGIYAKMCLN